MKDSIKRNRKSFRKLIKHNGKDMRTAVRDRLLPPGGPAKALKMIQTTVQSSGQDLLKINWAERKVDKEVYQMYFAILIAVIYSSMPQGRIGGVGHMSIENGRELTATGRTMVKYFKTSKSFIYQAVMISVLGKPLLNIYMVHLRPFAVQQRPEGASGLTREKDGQYIERLFLTSSGEPHNSIGTVYTKFCEQATGVHLTTTATRALWETLAHDAHENGEITLAEREATAKINNHSGVIAAKHYVYRERMHDADVVADVSERLWSISDTSFSSATPDAAVEVSFPAQQELEPYEFGEAERWGYERADFNNSEATTAAWTDKEKVFIGEYCLNRLRGVEEGSEAQAVINKNLVSSCLTYIRGEGRLLARPIFHQLHVARSERLKNGYQATIKMAAYKSLPVK